MQKKYWIIPGIIATALLAGFFALSTPGSQVKTKAKPTCCKKLVRECREKPDQPASDQTSFDNLSNQFISLPVYN